MRSQRRTYAVVAIVALAVAVSLYVPFYFDQPVVQQLDTGMGFISGISTIITLLIALYLFNRFGLENEVLTKKAEVVFELMGELKKLRFILTLKDGGFVQYFPSYYQLYEQKATMEGYLDYELLFSIHYIEQIEKITDLMSHIFMPLNIKEKLVPVCEVFSIQGTPITANHLCVAMTPMMLKVGDDAQTNTEKNDERLRNEVHGLLNHKSMKYRDFMGHWERAIAATKSWLQDHSLHHEVNL